MYPLQAADALFVTSMPLLASETDDRIESSLTVEEAKTE
jgi:hypothetical protein